MMLVQVVSKVPHFSTFQHCIAQLSKISLAGLYLVRSTPKAKERTSGQSLSLITAAFCTPTQIYSSCPRAEQ